MRLLKAMMMAVAFLLICNLMGCSKGNENAAVAGDPATVPKETGPVSLSIYQAAAFTEDEFQKYIAEPIKKKYPNITITMIYKDKQLKHEDMLNQLITANNVPDLLYIDAGALALSEKLGLAYDLTAFAKSQQFDWNRFDAGALEAIKQEGPHGEMYSVPFSLNIFGLFYNKDIFDKFGVPYPKDGQTWNDLVEIGKKLERTEGGVKYRGFAPGSFSVLSSPLSLAYVDPKTNLAKLQTDGWKKAVETYKMIEDISEDKSGGVLPFFQNRNIAMLPNSVNLINNIQGAIDKGGVLNWDLAQFPSYPNLSNVGPQTVVPSVAITATSRHKDAAFQIIDYLTSREVQQLLSRNARVSALKDPELKTMFGADFPGLKGKHVQSVFKSVPAKPAPQSDYDDIVSNEFNKVVLDFAKGKVADVNTTLRTAEEAANKAIQAAK
jgi:multiple sugar transport system substrate-binding protein